MNLYLAGADGLCFALLLSGSGLTLLYGQDTHAGVIVAPLVVLGIGIGLVLQPTLVALQAHSPKSRRAVIISSRNFNRCAGGACGLAISAAVLQAVLRANLPPDYAYLAQSTYNLPDMDDIPAEVVDAYMSASYAVFIYQVPLIGLCFLGTFFIRDRGLTFADEANDEDGKKAKALKDDSDTDLEAGSEASSSRSSVLDPEVEKQQQQQRKSTTAAPVTRTERE